MRVVTDATAMRSVFYSVDGGVLASHALLVEQALGGEVVRVIVRSATATPVIAPPTGAPVS